MELEQIVGQADQPPLRSHLPQAVEQELAKASPLLDLAEDRLDDSFPLTVAIDVPCRPDTPPGALDLEVRVAERRVDVKVSRRDGRQHFREIERELSGIFPPYRLDPRHVASLTPAGEVAPLVVGEGVEPGARHDDLDPRIERADEQGVVPSQRHPTAADPLRVDLGSEMSRSTARMWFQMPFIVPLA